MGVAALVVWDTGSAGSLQVKAMALVLRSNRWRETIRGFTISRIGANLS